MATKNQNATTVKFGKEAPVTKMAAITHQQQVPAADPSLVNALYNTFNPNQQARQAAESVLAAAHAQPGYLHALFAVLLSDPAALPLPQGAQAAYSRFIRQAGWFWRRLAACYLSRRLKCSQTIILNPTKQTTDRPATPDWVAAHLHICF